MEPDIGRQNELRITATANLLRHVAMAVEAAAANFRYEFCMELEYMPVEMAPLIKKSLQVYLSEHYNKTVVVEVIHPMLVPMCHAASRRNTKIRVRW